MKRLLAVIIPVLMIGTALLVVPGGTASAADVLKGIATGKIQPGRLTVPNHGHTVTKALPFVSNASVVAAQDVLCQQHAIPNCDERLGAADGGGNVAVDGSAGSAGSTATGSGAAHSLGCGGRTSNGNKRANQDCTYRRQAEEEQVYNPADPNNLVGGQNDSRVGYNQCGIDFSTNNGTNYGDLLPPFRQKLNDPASQEPTAGDPNRHTIMGGPGTFHTYDAASDPALAFDSHGRAFFSCVVFDIASNASGLYTTMSPVGAEGSFFYNWTGRPFTVVEDNSPLAFHDKNFIAADIYPSSPNRDNVYTTWTVFRFDSDGNYQRSPIFGSMSTDHGIHWSTPEEISGTSDALCVLGDVFDPTQPANACDFDQGSDPVVLPNGDLEVIFNNGNTPVVNGQQLGVHCRPTGNSVTGTATLGCGTPAKVGEDVSIGEPQCDFGRGPEECIPGAYLRTNDFPRILTENTQNGHLYAVWQDYRNGEYDIQESQSLDGGLTWRETGTVNPDRGLDHYFPAVDQSPQGNDRVGSSYFRTQRVPNENAPGDSPGGGGVFAPCDSSGTPEPDTQGCAGTGNSDYVVAGGTAGHTPYAFKVVSPVFTPPDGIQTGFNGDYSGIVINKGVEAHPIWSDTRNVDPYAPTNGVIHDEDVFTDKVGLPNGNAAVGPGVIGKS